MEAFFLPAGPGRTGNRFGLCHRAQGPVRGGVLYLHPFAEEMNKARRMAALQARALAADGWTVLLLDLAGCGDSSGDFADASWADWQADVSLGLAWLRQQVDGPVWAWGLRAGGLLAAQAAAVPDGPDHLLLWQPPASGRLLLQQFLRMRAAADMLDGGGKGVVEQLRRELAEGRPVEVAGYTLGAGLALGLDAASTRPPSGRAGHLVLMELSAAGHSLSPGVQRLADTWQSAGWQLQTAAVAGPSFWQTTEIETAPALLPATLAALDPISPRRPKAVHS